MATSPRGRLATLWAFSRPHTIIGTVTSVLVLWLLAADDAGRYDCPGPLLVALVGSVAANVYIVGVNQVTDVAIDRINKPELPIPAGDLSLRAARGIVAGSLALALGVGALAGPWLLTALALGVAVGSAYSLPPLRLKRSPVWAALAVSSVRGVVVNLVLSLWLTEAVGGVARLTPRVVVVTVVVTALALVIAWLKDVPDTEGDRRHGVRTLTLRLGAARVVRLAVVVFAAAQVAFVAAAFLVRGLDPVVVVVGAAAILTAALTAAVRVDLTARGSFPRFYLRIWGLFYAQYAVVAAAALTA